MWAMTSYFNPMRYKRRFTNYKMFREKLRIPLVTVELSFDGNFELTDKDADILIQISGGAVLWQQNRLLNVALKSVPPDTKIVAWIDCDVIFDRSDWVDEAKKQLNTFNIVQLISDGIDLKSANDHPDNYQHDNAAPIPGVIRLISEKQFSTFEIKTKARAILWGMAWAARKEILDEHGLYDAMIIGGGGKALLCGIYGQFEKLTELFYLDSARRDHYLKWARPFHKAVGERAGYVSGRLYHLWHGDFKNWKYADRHQRLASFNFAPDADLVIGPNGAWQWARSRPDLEDFLVNYFINRAEDG